MGGGNRKERGLERGTLGLAGIMVSRGRGRRGYTGRGGIGISVIRGLIVTPLPLYKYNHIFI